MPRRSNPGSARFQTFTIGDETIRDTRILFADLFGEAKYTVSGTKIPQRMQWMFSMLLGFDFLQSHRVLIAHSQRKIYFTYAGGRVFDLFQQRASRNEGGPSESARPGDDGS